MLQHLPYQLPLIVAALLLQWKDIPDVRRLCQQRYHGILLILKLEVAILTLKGH